MKTIHPAIAEHAVSDNARLQARIAELEGQLAALTQQAEPDHVEDMRAMVEPATAQDEREAFIAAAKHHKVEGLGFNLEATSSGSLRDNETRMLHEGWKLARSTRPAQTEQQPVAVPEGWSIELGFDVLDRSFRFVESKSHTPTIKVIFPPCEPVDSSAWDLRDEVARRIGSVLATPAMAAKDKP